MNLLGALVGENRLEVVRVPDDWILQRDPVSAEHGPSGPRDVNRGPHVAHLAEAYLFWRHLASFLEPPDVQCQELSPLQVSQHPGELALGQLETADLPPELLARPGVVGRRLQ